MSLAFIFWEGEESVLMNVSKNVNVSLSVNVSEEMRVDSVLPACLKIVSLLH
jgi:hypothetical protein